MKMSVVLAGDVRGMGREGRCEVLATRSASAGEPETYSDLRLLRTPKGWPDGSYVAQLPGFTAHLTLLRGEWHITRNADPAAKPGVAPEPISDL